MAGQPLVSVVTPVRNGEKYIAECIESVLAQTYSNWEYVIVNNFSTDRTLEIARQYAGRDSRIRVHDNAESLPIMANWNHALRQMSPASKYCKVVHADDWMYPACLERMVSLAEANPSAAVIGAFKMKDSEVKPDPSEIGFTESLLDGHAVCRSLLLSGNSLFGSPSVILLRSDVVRESPAFYTDLHMHPDAEACYEILQNHDFGFVHEVLTYSRSHDGSVTSAFRPLSTGLLSRYHLIRKFGPVFLGAEEFDALLRHQTRAYYTYLCTTLLFGRRKAWNYHVAGLRKLGYDLNSIRLLQGAWTLARLAASRPRALIQGLLNGAPLEAYAKMFSRPPQARKHAIQGPAGVATLGGRRAAGEHG